MIICKTFHLKEAKKATCLRRDMPLIRLALPRDHIKSRWKISLAPIHLTYHGLSSGCSEFHILSILLRHRPVSQEEADHLHFKGNNSYSQSFCPHDFQTIISSKLI